MWPWAVPWAVKRILSGGMIMSMLGSGWAVVGRHERSMPGWDRPGNLSNSWANPNLTVSYSPQTGRRADPNHHIMCGMACPQATQLLFPTCVSQQTDGKTTLLLIETCVWAAVTDNSVTSPFPNQTEWLWAGATLPQLLLEGCSSSDQACWTCIPQAFFFPKQATWQPQLS